MIAQFKEKSHAKFSASGSQRFLDCPGSIKAEEAYPNTDNEYSVAGNIAHDLIKKHFDDGKDIADNDFFKDGKNEDLLNSAKEYIKYVNKHEGEVRYYEKKVSFSDYAPNGFGTVDAIVYNSKTKFCHIFDFKSGRVFVDVEDNTQLKMYALGVYQEKLFPDAEKYFIHIIQPMSFNTKYQALRVSDIVKFGKYVKKRVRLAMVRYPKRIAVARSCKYCKARKDCGVAAKSTITSIGFVDKTNEHLTEEQKNFILKNLQLIKILLSGVEEEALERLEKGEEIEGFTIGRKRTYRRFTKEAEDYLVEKLGEEAYEKKLIAIGKAEKKLSLEEIEAITYKPEGEKILQIERS